MEISHDELKDLLKDARNTGFMLAFMACFFAVILGGIFALYVYKSFEPNVATISQVQSGKMNKQELNDVSKARN